MSINKRGGEANLDESPKPGLVFQTTTYVILNSGSTKKLNYEPIWCWRVKSKKYFNLKDLSK
jgi:hypothetical protein